MREDKRTAELTSDFEDYDIGLDDDAGDGARGGKALHKKKRAKNDA
jgi:hypothetical protein